MERSRVEVPAELQAREFGAGMLSGILVGGALAVGLILTGTSLQSRLGGLVSVGVSVVMCAVGVGGMKLIGRTHAGPVLRGTIEGACVAIGMLGVLGAVDGAVIALFGRYDGPPIG